VSDEPAAVSDQPDAVSDEPVAGSDQPVIGWPTDGALWASMAATLRDVVLPDVSDPHHRQVVIQLVGLATYARGRGPDPTPARVAEIAAALDALVGEGSSLVAARWSGDAGDPAAIMAAASAVLADAVQGDDPDGLAARDALRAILVRHLDEDLATEDVLLSAFRGRLPDG
jgi:hypothetical protein